MSQACCISVKIYQNYTLYINIAIGRKITIIFAGTSEKSCKTPIFQEITEYQLQ